MSRLGSLVGGTTLAIGLPHAREQYNDALWKYFYSRVGAPELADELLNELWDQIQAGAVDGYAPTERAVLFDRARHLLFSARGEELEAADTIPDHLWSESGMPGELGRKLSGREKELWELQYLHTLDGSELSFVFDATVEKECSQIAAKVEGSRDEHDEALRFASGFLEQERSRSKVPSTWPQLLKKGDRVGRFVVVDDQPLGRGNFGEVYKAHDPTLRSRHVAIKILRRKIEVGSPEHELAMHELQMLSCVWHPSIVQLAEYGIHEQHLWFAMPWISGHTLADHVRSHKRLSREDAEYIFSRLGEALVRLHQEGIRHQDIKPGNILLSHLRGRWFPILIDFGIGAHKEDQHLIGGTPLYVAPEIARRLVGGGDGVHEVDTKADVFSLGLTLLHSLDPSLQEVLPPGTHNAFLRKRAHHSPRVPSRSSKLADVSDFVRGAVALEPDHRLSAEEFLKGLPCLTEPERRRQRWRKRAPWLAAGAFALSLLLAFFIAAKRDNHELRENIEQRKVANIRVESLAILEDIWRERDQLEFAQETSRLIGSKETNIQHLRATVHGLEQKLEDTGEQLKSSRKREEQTARNFKKCETMLEGTGKRMVQLKDRITEAEGEVARAVRRAGAAQSEAQRAKRQVAVAKQQAAKAARVAREEQRKLHEQITDLKAKLAAKAKAASVDGGVGPPPRDAGP